MSEVTHVINEATHVKRHPDCFFPNCVRVNTALYKIKLSRRFIQGCSKSRGRNQINWTEHPGNKGQKNFESWDEGGDCRLSVLADWF